MAVALASPLIGFLMFVYTVAVSRHGFLYIRSWAERLAFFFSPYGPPWYILVKMIDGRIEAFYNATIVKGTRTYLLKLGELILVMDSDPDEEAVSLSLWDARGPSGMSSPYGLAWRVILSWGVAVYASFLAFDFTFLSSAVSGTAIPAEGWATLMIFLLELMYMMMLLRHMQVPSTKYLGLIVVGVDPPHMRAVPELSASDPRPPARMLARLGRKVVFNVSPGLEKLIAKLRERLGSDEAVVNWLVEQAELAVLWRKNLAEIRDEMRTVRTVARRMVRMWELRDITRPSFSKLLVWLLFFGIGAVVGYVFGSSWAVSAQPPPWYAYTNTSMYTQTSTISPPVQPAPAPPPPPVPAANAMPVQPAPAPAPPPPSGNQTGVQPAT